MAGKGRARRTDPATSHKAVGDERVNEIEAKYYSAVFRAEPLGLCNHEVEDITGLDEGSVTPRPSEMEARGLLVRVGERIPRGVRADGVPHQASQTVWRIAPRYREMQVRDVNGRPKKNGSAEGRASGRAVRLDRLIARYTLQEIREAIIRRTERAQQKGGLFD